MSALDRLLLRRLLPAVLSRRCEERIPRSGERAQGVNCFVVYAPQNGAPELLLDRIDGEHIHALSWDGSRFTIPVTVALSDVDPVTVVIEHYWGLSELRFHGARHLAFGIWTKLPYARVALHRLRENAAQKIFNRRSMTSRKRLLLLRELVEAALAGQGQLSALDLMTRRYGYRWAGHPQWREHQRELQVQLAMLAETGELRAAAGAAYAVTGHAMRALEQEEEADRKQRTNVYLQLAIVLLTAATVFTGLVQAELMKFPTLVDLRSKPATPRAGVTGSTGVPSGKAASGPLTTSK